MAVAAAAVMTFVGGIADFWCSEVRVSYVVGEVGEDDFCWGVR